MIPDTWLASRCNTVEMSGIRKVFELGKSLKDPINLSIGQPHFAVPEQVKSAAKSAIDAGHNGYTVTQGIPELLSALKADLRTRFPGQERDVLVTSGTSGALLLALLATINPGDEVITADPYFVAYPNLVATVGGKLVAVDTYPDFKLDLNKLEAAFTPRTKVVLLSTPSNPTGAVIDPAIQKQLAELCRKRGVLLISDEIYRAFHYDSAPASPAAYDPNVIVCEGFGKTYAITGWRLGWVHGPARLIQEMAKFQQFTFVCAPSMVQHAGVAALQYDVSEIVADYREKRNRITEALKDVYELNVPGGAFYLFPRAPWGSATEFVTEAVKLNLLLIPGSVFSKRDTHLRISYAATDETLTRGIEILLKLARK